jgi:glycosyltransferase involved in cell wall biosynthesis
VVHNGVDIETFCPAEQAGDGRVHFVYPSRILPGKAQHLAIDALARLPQRYKERCRLTIVGAASDGVYLDRIRVQSFDQPVEFAVDVPEIHPYYQAADVILFPTMMTEGFGFTAAEGMACGKPVIWFEQPAVREATGGIGLPVPQGDVDAMRDAMMNLIDDQELRRSIGDAGLRYVRQNLSWGRVWSQYEAVLREVSGV